MVWNESEAAQEKLFLIIQAMMKELKLTNDQEKLIKNEVISLLAEVCSYANLDGRAEIMGHITKDN